MEEEGNKRNHDEDDGRPNKSAFWSLTCSLCRLRVGFLTSRALSWPDRFFVCHLIWLSTHPSHLLLQTPKTLTCHYRWVQLIVITTLWSCAVGAAAMGLADLSQGLWGLWKNRIHPLEPLHDWSLSLSLWKKLQQNRKQMLRSSLSLVAYFPIISCSLLQPERARLRWIMCLRRTTRCCWMMEGDNRNDVLRLRQRIWMPLRFNRSAIKQPLALCKGIKSSKNAFHYRRFLESVAFIALGDSLSPSWRHFMEKLHQRGHMFIMSLLIKKGSLVVFLFP